VEICLVSSLSFPTLPPSIGCQWLPPQLVRCDDKYTFWLRVWHINDPQGLPSPCLPDGNPSTSPTTAVFTWTTDDFFDFLFGDAMVIDVWLASCWIVVEADMHAPFPHYSGGRESPNASAQPRPKAEARNERKL
jgi:hypothetical protein